MANEVGIFIRAWDKTRGAFSSVEAGFRSLLGRVRGVAGGITSALTAPLRMLFDFRTMLAGGGLAAGIGGAVKKAFDVETSIAQFKVLTGSMSKAQAVYAELKKYADLNPLYDLPETLQAGRLLMAFGVSANEVAKTLSTLGDVSAAVNMPLGEMAELVGRNLVQGRLYQIDLRQLQGRGIPIIEMLAKKYHVTAGAIMEMTTAGKISSRDMMDALSMLTAKGGKFAGMMDEIVKTGGGQWAQLTANWSSAVTEFGQGLSGLAKDVIGNLNARLEKLRNNGTFQELADKVVKAASLMKDALGSILGGDKKTIDLVFDVVKGAFYDAAHGAVKILVAAGPLIGQLIGAAAKAAFSGERGGAMSVARDQMVKEGLLSDDGMFGGGLGPEAKRQKMTRAQARAEIERRTDAILAANARAAGEQSAASLPTTSRAKEAAATLEAHLRATGQYTTPNYTRPQGQGMGADAAATYKRMDEWRAKEAAAQAAYAASHPAALTTAQQMLADLNARRPAAAAGDGAGNGSAVEEADVQKQIAGEAKARRDAAYGLMSPAGKRAMLAREVRELDAKAASDAKAGNAQGASESREAAQGKRLEAWGTLTPEQREKMLAGAVAKQAGVYGAARNKYAGIKGGPLDMDVPGGKTSKDLADAAEELKQAAAKLAALRDMLGAAQAERAPELDAKRREAAEKTLRDKEAAWGETKKREDARVARAAGIATARRGIGGPMDPDAEQYSRGAGWIRGGNLKTTAARGFHFEDVAQAGMMAGQTASAFGRWKRTKDAPAWEAGSSLGDVFSARFGQRAKGHASPEERTAKATEEMARIMAEGKKKTGTKR